MQNLVEFLRSTLAADIGNALFEAIGGVMIWLDVLRLRRDKTVKGVYWPTRIFFFSWGVWNLYYYGPALDQWLSWTAGLVIVVANFAWCALAIWYLFLKDRIEEARAFESAFGKVAAIFKRESGRWCGPPWMCTAQPEQDMGLACGYYNKADAGICARCGNERGALGKRGGQA